jgi:hypothetical protein
MKIIPLLDFEAKAGSFEEEAISLDLDYYFKHIFDKAELNSYKTIFITDKALSFTHELKEEGKDLYAWLLEPPSIMPHTYSFVESNIHLFKGVFSHNKDFVDRVSIAQWYPWGSYYIPRHLHAIYPKTKNVSIVASAKNFTHGHKARHEVVSRFSNLIDDIKCGDPVEPKFKWHKDHRYSIAIENKNIRGYFTEKIIDCFRTGTIPIYMGDQGVADHFDPNGIIFFDSVSDLEFILPICNKDLYESKMNAIKHNYVVAEKFLYPWKYIKENYLKHEVF